MLTHHPDHRYGSIRASIYCYVYNHISLPIFEQLLKKKI